MGSLASPHVVVVPIFPAGHSIPFLLFSRRLVAEGFTVTFVSSDKHISELIASLGTQHLSPQRLPLRFLGLRDGSEHLTHRGIFEERKTQAGREKGIKLLVELIIDITSPKALQLRGVPTAAFPVCVLHDSMACWAQEAAEKLQIEKHLLYTSPTACLSIAIQSERLAREGRVPVTPDNEHIPITGIPGLPILQPVDLPTLFLFPESYEWMKYNDYRTGKADVLLCNSFYDLEKQVIDAVRKEVIGTPGVESKCLLEVGPLLQEPHPTNSAITNINLNENAIEEKDPCILWLNTQKPASVVYVCFGSHTTHQAPQLLELALGLEASGQPFLWIMCPPDSLPVELRNASGAPKSMTEYLPLGFEERMKGRGMCYSGWTPQQRILNHVAVGGFVTHCGWNSIMESVCAGVPMLTWPFWADQNINGRFLVDTAKLAIELEREPLDRAQDIGNGHRIKRRVRKEEISRQVHKLMHEEEGRVIRQNVQQMKLNAQRAVAPGGSSTRNFENYVCLLHARATAASEAGFSKIL
ncbi:hypothetical protein KC19_7G029400 [Ceratodon purpureus]|uniref:Glycosyltransferase n=1 Tax=Ceratodon purpureus TaxID=3225 RepID=A0A8T0H739_CERPU|nr:hypothetical protein KC19_7G029400 [Ceratodon purpureus]